MIASHRGCKGAVRLLLARGARQELQNNAGETALHLAVYKNNEAVVPMLRTAPGAAAVVALRDDRNRTAITRLPSTMAAPRAQPSCASTARRNRRRLPGAAGGALAYIGARCCLTRPPPGPACAIAPRARAKK
jgi:ankyrin repeat protein